MSSSEFLEGIIKEIVEFPDKIKTVRTEDDRGILITLEVAQEDIGKVVGNRGTTASALRTLLRVYSGRNGGERTSLIIKDPQRDQ